jgi:hypothetical protein
MRRLGFALVALLGAATVAAAQNAAYVYTWIGFQQVAVISSNANFSVLTVPNGARVAQICVEVNAVRYTEDGLTNPSATFGQPVSGANFPVCFPYSGPLVNLRFSIVTAPAVLSVSYYR